MKVPCVQGEEASLASHADADQVRQTLVYILKLLLISKQNLLWFDRKNKYATWRLRIKDGNEFILSLLLYDLKYTYRYFVSYFRIQDLQVFHLNYQNL